MSFSNIMDSNSYAGAHDDPATESLITARERVLGPSYRLFYERPVHLVRGQGSHLFDNEGNRYLDAYNNVASVGHCHPHVVGAVTRQLSALNTHTRYLHEGIVDYSERLLATMPTAIDQVMYACTGSEANDLALRVAQRYTGHKGIVVTSDAYHGNTAAVTAISPSLGETRWERTFVPSRRPTAIGPHRASWPSASPPTYRMPSMNYVPRDTGSAAWWSTPFSRRTGSIRMPRCWNRRRRWCAPRAGC